MKPSDFNKPTSHPYGMLAGYKDAHEQEDYLASMLYDCIEFGDWIVFPSSRIHSQLPANGLMERFGYDGWKLTKKAIGLLYTIYGK
jgi:hypothetical protein